MTSLSDHRPHGCRNVLACALAAVASLASAASTRADALAITPILPFDYGVTGVRADAGGDVVISGGTGLPNLIQGTPAFIYSGPLAALASATSPGDPRLHLFRPTFGGTQAFGAMFYGPNTHRFNPSAIPAGSIRAVGAYLQSSPADFQKGMIYDGPLDGSGTWTSLQVPGADVAATIPHSTMGNLIVGNYNLLTDLSIAHPFVYDIVGQSYKRLDINSAYAATIYGIWQNGGETSTAYTIIGGLKQTSATTGEAFVASYDSATQTLSGLVTYNFDDDPTIDTHFEGISEFNGGFSIAANYVSGASSAAYAFISHSGAVGSYVYGPAVWKSVTNTINGSSHTGDTVIDDKVMGIYAVPGGIRSFITTVPEIDPAASPGGVAAVLGTIGLLERRLRRRRD